MADFWIGWAAGVRIEDTQSGFRSYPARLLREVVLRHDRARSFVYESEILIEAARRGFPCRNIAVSAMARPGQRPSNFQPLASDHKNGVMEADKARDVSERTMVLSHGQVECNATPVPAGSAGQVLAKHPVTRVVPVRS